MSKYSILALIVLLSVAFVMSAPVDNEEPEVAPAPAELESLEEGASKKTKRGIYGSYGYGFGYPFGYSHYPYGGYYGGYYSHYPYVSLGYGYGHHGYGHYW